MTKPSGHWLPRLRSVPTLLEISMIRSAIAVAGAGVLAASTGGAALGAPQKVMTAPNGVRLDAPS